MSDSSKSGLISGMHWRRAAKSFSPGEIDISMILEAIALAPSSSGLTPYKVYVVSDASMKTKLRAVSYCQAQVEEAHSVLYFSVLKDAKFVVDRFIGALNLDETNPSYAAMIRGGILSMTKDEYIAWARAQAYIALGVALATAAEQRISSCPMEGLSSAEVGQLLGVSDDEQVFCCLAIGAEQLDKSKASPYPKYRLPVDQVIIRK